MTSRPIEVRFTITQRALLIASSMVFGALVGVATMAVAFADGDNATQTVVGSDLILPYDGYMMVDSAPLTGTRTIKFELFEASSGGAAVWTEEQAVTLYNGRFSVGLGTSTTLTATILDAEKLWLAMTVVDTSSGSRVEVALSGRQAIEPAPFAAWSANSADFNVAGALTVGQGATITGATTVTGALDVTGDATLTGVESDGSSAALSIKTTGTTQEMLLDGNEIDVVGASLNLQKNTAQATIIHAALNTKTTTTLGDDSADQTTVNGPIKLEQNLTFADNKDIFGVDIIRGYDDIRLRATASTSSDTMKLTDTAITLNENTTVNGTFAADSATISGALTLTSGFTVTEHSESVTGTNGSGTSNTSNMITVGNGFCALARVDLDDVEDGERSRCRIILPNSGVWQLQAYVEGGTSTVVRCEAFCFSWK